MSGLTEAGKNSEVKGVVLHHALMGEAEDYVRMFLADQPQSWAMFYTLDELIEEIKEGRMQALMVLEGDAPVGLVLTTYNRVGSKLVMRPEFMTCKAFFSMAKLYDTFEHWAKQVGADYIAGMLHPTIAKYAVKKHEYSVMGVFAIKGLGEQRRH